MCWGLIFSNLQAYEIFSNARQYSMGGAYSALALGAEATFLNPANLGLVTRHKFSLNLLGLGAELSNNAFSHLLYQQYVGDYWDADEIELILNEIPEEGISLNSNAKVQGISMGYGSFAIGLRGFSSYSSFFARELFELALKGNELNRVYTFNPVTGDGMSGASLGLAYGKGFNIKRDVVETISFGVLARYIHGFSYVNIVESDFYSQTTYSSIEGLGHLAVDYSEGGKGYAFNVATTFKFANQWQASLIYQNAISSMTWKRNSQKIFFDFRLNQNNLESILNNDGRIDSLILSRDSSAVVPEFSTQLPQIIRFGVLVPVKDQFKFTLEYEQGFENTALSSEKPRFSFGGELRVSDFFLVRTGISLGGRYENHYSGGFGFLIDRFCWDVAMRTYNGITSTTSKGFGLATSLAVRL